MDEATFESAIRLIEWLVREGRDADAVLVGKLVMAPAYAGSVADPVALGRLRVALADAARLVDRAVWIAAGSQALMGRVGMLQPLVERLTLEAGK